MIDKYLIKLGRIVPILCKEDTDKIKITKIDKKKVLSNPSVTTTILHYILQT